MTDKLQHTDEWGVSSDEGVRRTSDQDRCSGNALVGASSIPIEFLTVRCPATGPSTTQQAWMERHSEEEDWCYRAAFGNATESLEDISATNAIVEGVVHGKRFHFTEPDVIFGGHDLTFYPNEHGYQRFGSLEKRGGAWQRIATAGIANPTEVRRTGFRPDRELDTGADNEYGMAHIWHPESEGRGDAFPTREIIHLICVLPRRTSPDTVAELAARYLPVNEDLVEDTVPDLRQKIARGETKGPEFFKWDGTVGCYTPDWADTAPSAEGGDLDG